MKKFDASAERKISKKIRKGDTVIVITGVDRGKTGSVLACKGERATVQGINIKKKHVKRSEQHKEGGIIELEKPIHISNLKLCTSDEKPIKVKINTTKDGERQLVYKLDGKEVLHRSLKKS